MIETLDLRGGRATDPKVRGELQGEAWREDATALVVRRVDALRTLAPWKDEQALEGEGHRCLGHVGADGTPLRDELEGIARALGLPAYRLALAGSFEDLWDRAGGDEGPGDAGRTTLYVVGESPVLGQSLLAGDERAALRRLRLDRDVTVMTLAGLLGIGGARPGLLLAANHLRSGNAGPGTALGVEVRRALEAPDAAGAKAVLASTPRGGGRFFLVSDGVELYGCESDGPRFVLTRRGPKTAHTHTDHFFDPVLRRVELRDVRGSSYRRTELSTSVYVQRQPATPREVWQFLDELDALRGASGDEDRDLSTRSLKGRSAIWVARGSDGASWARSGLESEHDEDVPAA